MPTLRESNGLAMSSRNQYLSQEMKDKSSLIYQGLKLVKIIISIIVKIAVIKFQLMKFYNRLNLL